MQRLKTFTHILILTISFFGAFPVMAQSTGDKITAKVVGVHDGDTITVLTPQMEEIKIRLGEIDAPEMGQPYGEKSKKLLSDLVFDKDVEIIKTATDRYGRTVGRIYMNGADVNLLMVQAGGAWAYTDYLTDNNIKNAENTAKASKVGLWGLQADQITPPWEWRHEKRAEKAAKKSGSLKKWFSEVQPPSIPQTQYEPPAHAPSPAVQPEPYTRVIGPGSSAASSSCGAKSTCGQMADCAEARFYLNSCGLSNLDRDGDGVPCESLCK